MRFPAPRVATAIPSRTAPMRDRVGSLFGVPHYSAIVGHPGETAALTSLECWEGFAGLMPEGADWENKVLSRIFLKLPFYSPVRAARRIKAPTLIVAGGRDTVTPASAALRAALRIPGAEFHMLDGNHFDLHHADESVGLQNVELQIAFLNRHVGTDRQTETLAA